MNFLPFQSPLCSLIFFTCTVLTLPLNDLLPATSSSNITSASLLKGIIPAYCTKSVAWTGDAGLESTFLSDCGRVNMEFWNAEVIRHGVSEFEFLNKESAPAHRNPRQQTPRRYTYRDCTIALINKPDIPDPYWPGDQQLSKQPVTDTASYDEIYMSLLAITAECLHDHRQAGWAVTGQ